MKVFNFGLRILLWLAVFFRFGTMAGVLAARIMGKNDDSGDGEEIALLMLMVPAEVAHRLEPLGIAAGAVLAATEDKFDDRVLAGGLSGAMMVLAADRAIAERRRYG
ncbi:hypothetical protein LWC34_02395 [Kibdelosporangium philippinense]|uniref:Uncharacterized protein n=1 Tax=Kibdelosporangium philippinense TaxID=211113 RepID=A0ABS8Z189_9PSEU|nr:hypothetical protein [Kibdelosporangium philippinense]MCE7001696.1 hypothetical protein [Kibdelosporangium philippinense]